MKSVLRLISDVKISLILPLGGTVGSEFLWNSATAVSIVLLLASLANNPEIEQRQ